ncbi:MAG TPA: hypothetical protein VFE09_09530, partial [Rubrobacteraceae bacterium]|nr:hypothetical protein [Rubrobacteraceae bacterium]
MLRSPVDVGRLRGPGKKNGKKKEAEPSITRAKMQVRVVGLAALVSVLFLVLAFRLWYLQVLTGEEYTNTAQATQ